MPTMLKWQCDAYYMNSLHLNQAGISSPAFKFMFACRLHPGQGLWAATKRRRSVLALHRAASKMGHAVASQAQGAPNSDQSITYLYKLPLHYIVTSTSKNLGNHILFLRQQKHTMKPKCAFLGQIRKCS